MTSRARAIALVGVALIAGAAIGTRWRRGPKLEVGGVYTIQDLANDFGSPREFHVVKVIALDNAVHVRSYGQTFRNRPATLEGVSLTLGTDHIPLSHAAFAAWQPVLISRSKVAPSELAGYQEWLRTYHGVWR